MVLDLDAPDDPIHRGQEVRFSHGYYEGYCYSPLYSVVTLCRVRN